ncbi:MAG: MotA/TolQ/ExbB proton channel family protein [Planctomycetota bacterium]|jgi:biopolymer transport protein ExbB
MIALVDDLALLIQRGGYIMIPLLVLSVISLTLIIERSWFWIRVNGGGGPRRLDELNRALRRGDRTAVLAMVGRDRSPYGSVARHLLDQGTSDAVALEAVERQRPRLDRFMVTISTTVTAAPLLGILGTVIGIIQSFNLLGQQDTLTDPRVVSAGIAEALLTTALGLVVALVNLFPYMIFRGQASRSMGHLESVIAAAQEGIPATRRDSRTDVGRPRHDGAEVIAKAIGRPADEKEAVNEGLAS